MNDTNEDMSETNGQTLDKSENSVESKNDTIADPNNDIASNEDKSSAVSECDHSDGAAGEAVGDLNCDNDEHINETNVQNVENNSNDNQMNGEETNDLNSSESSDSSDKFMAVDDDEEEEVRLSVIQKLKSIKHWVVDLTEEVTRSDHSLIVSDCRTMFSITTRRLPILTHRLNGILCNKYNNENTENYWWQSVAKCLQSIDSIVFR